MKYISRDSRTGYAEGQIVDLSDKKLEAIPFNIFMENVENSDKESRLIGFEQMTKDELLDYTAINGIEADYSMTKKNIIKLIKGE